MVFYNSSHIKHLVVWLQMMQLLLHMLKGSPLMLVVGFFFLLIRT